MKKTLATQIVEIISTLSHASTKDVYLDLQHDNEKISLRRVQNTINKLCEGGELTILKLDGFDDHYEVNKGPHNHFVCKECGKIMNINSQVVMPEGEEGPDGFKVDEIKITIYGICADCNNEDDKLLC